MANDYSYKNVNTHLIYDLEWDAIMQWLKSSEINLNDSRQYGNYFDRKTTNKNLVRNFMWGCGAYNVANTNNIFDLAGNVREWTMGKYNGDKRITRGGSCYSSGIFEPIMIRSPKYESISQSDLGFRPALVTTN
jgi:formylglycine-generating enzyme required for sulfatase activity